MDPKSTDTATTELPQRIVGTDTAYYALGMIPASQDSEIVRLYLDALVGKVEFSDSICICSQRFSLCCSIVTEIHGCAIYVYRERTFRGDVVDSTVPLHGSVSLYGSWSRSHETTHGTPWDTLRTPGTPPFTWPGTWIDDSTGTQVKLSAY